MKLVKHESQAKFFAKKGFQYLGPMTIKNSASLF